MTRDAERALLERMEEVLAAQNVGDVRDIADLETTIIIATGAVVEAIRRYRQ